MNDERRLAAIMFTDLVGYSVLSQRDEQLALELLQEHRKLMRPIFPQHGGTVIKTMGDGFLVEFPSSRDAVLCAIELQRTLTAHNATVTPERRLQMRIGIHLGDVEHRDDDVFGDGVNIASRIEPLAEPGGICVTHAVYEQVATKIETSLISSGQHQLKGINAPVAVYKVVLPWEQAGAPRSNWNRRRAKTVGRVVLSMTALAMLVVMGWWVTSTFTQPSDSETGIASIAVLPFENLSADERNQYFSDGLTEELINALAQIDALRVISRTSAFNVNTDEMTLPEIGTELGVNYIIEGSVRRDNDDVRITAQLIRATRDENLWSQAYNRQFDDVFAIQQEIATSIADRLAITLAPEDEERLAREPTDSTEAYKLYLQGRLHWNKRTNEGFRTALDYFQQAIEADPDFAKAHAGIADSYSLLAQYDFMLPQKAYPQARQAAQRALQIDGGLAEAHASLGLVLQDFDGDFLEAEQRYRRAIELDPNYATAHQWYARLLLFMGRQEAALTEIDKAVALDPLSPIIRHNAAYLYADIDRDAAIEHLETALEINPTFRSARAELANLKYEAGELDEAEQLHRTMIENHPQDPVVYGEYGTFLQDIGRFDQALEQFKRALALNPSHISALYHFARTNELIGNWERAEVLWKEAIELVPGDIFIRYDYAVHLLIQGKTESARAQARRMLEIKPDVPNSHYGAAAIMRFVGRCDAVNEHLDRARELGSTLGIPIELSLCHAANEAWEQSIRSLEQAENLDPMRQNLIIAIQGVVYARTGQTEQSRQKLDQLLRLPEYTEGRDALIAWAYLAMGQLDRGFDWLDSAYDARGRNEWILLVNAWPLISDEVRADPRFQAIVKKLKVGRASTPSPAQCGCSPPRTASRPNGC